MRSVVSGVRSSCETSDTNLCCSIERFSSRSICFWIEEAISLKELPKLAISSSLEIIMRLERSPCVNLSATFAACCTGAITRLSKNRVLRAIKNTKRKPAKIKVQAMVAMLWY